MLIMSVKTRDLLRALWANMRDSKAALVMYLILNAVAALIGALVPFLYAQALLNIAIAEIDKVLWFTVVLFVANVVLNFTFYFRDLFSQIVYVKTLANIQTNIVKEILRLDMDIVNKKGSGLFIERLTADSREVARLFIDYANIVSGICLNAGVVITIFILNKYLFAYLVIAHCVIFFVNKIGIAKQCRVRKSLNQIQESKTSLLNELIKGVCDIKLLDAANNILRRTNRKINESSRKEMELLNAKRKLSLVGDNLGEVSNLFLIIIAIWLYTNNLLDIATFMVIFHYEYKIGDLLNGVIGLIEQNQKFTITVERIYEIINSKRFSKERFGKIKVDQLRGSIRFENVSFMYNTGRKILNDLSFEIKPGQKVAFVGKSGVGKTTIFNLILKLYTRTSGNILLDGCNIDDLDRSSLRKGICMIPQSPYVFNLSIKDNLRLAKRNASMEELRSVCTMACLDEYIMSLPDKYETIIGEGGVSLSGGQKQRLAIARSLLLDAKVILFDEAASALDIETQIQVQKAINNCKNEHTVLIITHRLSTITNCDKIFVIDNGGVVACGNHKELIASSELYRRLFRKG